MRCSTFVFLLMLSATLQAETIKVMTLNIGHARGDGVNQLLQSSRTAQKNLDQIASLLRKQAPDVVALQEVDRNSFWNGRSDHLLMLGELSGYPSRFGGEHIDGDRLRYGTALMGRVELREQTSVTFAKPFARPRKGFVMSEITWPDTHQPITLVSVHLDFLTANQRERETKQLIESLRHKKTPIVVMGDLNCSGFRENSPVRMLEAELNLVSSADSSLITFPKRGKQLDWILVSPEIEMLSISVLPDPVSDHLGLIAELQLKSNLAVAGM